MRKTRFITLCASLLAVTAPAFAEEMAAGPDSHISVSLNELTVDGDKLVTSLDVNTTGVTMPSKIKTVYLPMITNGSDTVCFDSFAVSGRKRWLNDYAAGPGQYSPVTFYGWSKEAGQLINTIPTSGQGYNVTEKGGSPTNFTITLSIPYKEWMGAADFVIDCRVYECSVCVKSYDVIGQKYFAMGQTDFLPLEFQAEYIFAVPEKEAEKLRNLPTRAYIDFKVNQTNILPKFGNNAKELAKIKETVDSIGGDSDITVQSIHVIGTASPEGPYKNNVRLAKGRAESLQKYMQKTYKLPKELVTSSYVPVNWDGLRAWLEGPECAANAANVPDAAAILGIVNSDLEDYARNQKIKTDYPEQYAWLLKNVYPGLRVTDYDIKYGVRDYTEIAEMVEVMNNAPKKLSVLEIYQAGQSQGPETVLFDESVDIAVETFPENPDANLNAGIKAMKQGDLTKAEKHLAKAGNREEAKFAKAQLAAMKCEYSKALSEFKALEKSSNSTVAAAAARAAENVELIMKRKK